MLPSEGDQPVNSACYLGLVKRVWVVRNLGDSGQLTLLGCSLVFVPFSDAAVPLEVQAGYFSL